MGYEEMAGDKEDTIIQALSSLKEDSDAKYKAHIERFGDLALISGILAGGTLILTGLANELSNGAELWPIGIGNWILIIGGAIMVVFTPIRWALSSWRQGKGGPLLAASFVSELREGKKNLEAEQIDMRKLSPELVGLYRRLEFLANAVIVIAERQASQARHLEIIIFAILGVSGIAMLTTGIDHNELLTVASGLILILGGFYLAVKTLKHRQRG